MYYFIWNPTAGKGEPEKALSVIKLFMGERGLQYTLLKTERAGHAAELAKKAAEDPEAMAVVAIGGDGTILETASGLIDADLPLACIPLGNGNDFMSNIIDLRKYRTVEEKTKRCLEVLLRGQRQTVDMIMVNGGYALNIGNIGLDADVADYAARIKHIFGSMSYIISMIKSIFTYKPLAASITVDGVKKRGLFTLIAVCNGTRYGGGFVIAPQARLDDGKLTLCTVDRIPRLKILVLFPLVLMGGRHSRLKEVKFTNCERVEIEYEGVTKMCLDGNIHAWKGPVSFVALPAALEMISEKRSLKQVDK